VLLLVEYNLKLARVEMFIEVSVEEAVIAVVRGSYDVRRGLRTSKQSSYCRQTALS